MTFLEAAEFVLKKAGSPLHYREIVRAALSQGILVTSGKTPDQTLNAQLATDIRDNPSSLFQRTDKGVFALKEWGFAKYAPTNDAQAPDSGSMSFTDAAEHVLEQCADKKPMHYKEIWRQADKQGLVFTQGRTPEQTLYSQILTETKRRQRRGETSRFHKHGNGFVGLEKWRATGLAYEIERHNTDVRKKLLSELKQMEPYEFEGMVEQLLVAVGFEDTEVTQASKDGGIDVRGTLVVGDVIRTRMAVQVKRWKNNVQSQDVQRVRGSLGTHEHGLIVTTSGFSAGAKAEAMRADAVPVALMNGEQMVALLVENGIGVTKSAYDLIELGNQDDPED